MYKCLLLLVVPFCPSLCSILCSFLCTCAPGLSQQHQSVHFLLLQPTACLMPALSSPLHGHPLLFPFLGIAVSPWSPYGAPSTSLPFLFSGLPASQTGRTLGYDRLDQLSGLPGMGRNGTPRVTCQRMSPGSSTASWPFLCPSAFIRPSCSTSPCS